MAFSEVRRRTVNFAKHLEDVRVFETEPVTRLQMVLAAIVGDPLIRNVHDDYLDYLVEVVNMFASVDCPEDHFEELTEAFFDYVTSEQQRLDAEDSAREKLCTLRIMYKKFFRPFGRRQ